MIKRIGIVVATLLVGLFGAVQPAQAAVHWDCAENAICLYQWQNFSGPNGQAGRWQSSFTNVNNHSNNCLNLTVPMAHWPNGDNVTDNSGSMVINGLPGGAWGMGWSIQIYNWANCNSYGGSSAYNMSSYIGIANLADVPMGGVVPVNAYHTITSIGVNYNCPPGGCS